MGESNSWKTSVEKAQLTMQEFHLLENAEKHIQQEAAKKWYGALSELIDAMHEFSDDAFRDRDNLINALWPIKGIAAELARGRVPEIVSVVQGAHAPPISLLEEADIDLARVYIQFTRLKIIDDKRPHQTIRDLYGVGRTTVQTWSKRPIDPDIICTKDRVQLLLDALKIAGARYKKAGRGQHGIASRDDRKTG